VTKIENLPTDGMDRPVDGAVVADAGEL